MCCQTTRACCGSRSARTSRLTGCGRTSCCSWESTAPTATISMADYEPFILVPTTVFDQGDVDCDCGCGCG